MLLKFDITTIFRFQKPCHLIAGIRIGQHVRQANERSDFDCPHHTDVIHIFGLYVLPQRNLHLVQHITIYSRFFLKI